MPVNSQHLAAPGRAERTGRVSGREKGKILRNFKADAVNPIVLSGLQPKMTLKSRKLEGGKAAAENSMQQSDMCLDFGCFLPILARSLFWGGRVRARTTAGPSP
jgi:hypothetical protein